MTSFKEKVDVFKAWSRKPLKMLHFLWFICVCISFICMLVLLSGLLKHRLVTKSQHDLWFEVNVQIINLLFTILCLYQHPRWCQHLFLLCRWRPEDASKLRRFYCKIGKEKPHERAHMVAIVILFQVTCFSQYIVCGLHWGYSISERPFEAIGISLLITISSVIIAVLYKTFGPLQKEDPNSGVDVEAPGCEGNLPRTPIFKA